MELHGRWQVLGQRLKSKAPGKAMVFRRLMKKGR